MTVHNHGPEEGAGLACREIRTHAGWKGQCLIQGYDHLSTIGNIFRGLREARGLNQYEAADLLNTTQARISYLESGANDLKISTLVKFAAGYGQDISILFKNEDGVVAEPAAPIPPKKRGAPKTAEQRNAARRAAYAKAQKEKAEAEKKWVPPKPFVTLLDKYGSK